LDANNLLPHISRLEELIRRELAPLRDHRYVRQIRQLGIMVGIELAEDGKPFAPERRMGHQVTLACRDNNLVLRNIGDVVVLMPAPAMSEELAVELCRIVREAIEATCGEC
jgi:adenosylmethionine-8-amino-7-oxononanoate aminotransferase